MIDISDERILNRLVQFRHPNGATVTGRIMAVRSPFVHVRVNGRSVQLPPAELSWPDSDSIAALPLPKTQASRR